MTLYDTQDDTQDNTQEQEYDQSDYTTTMRIAEHIVEQILRQTDIVEVVGEVVALRKRGSNYLGLCPFHNEKTPSFNVLPERGIFKCFGCGKGGNAAIFLRDYHKMSYPDALRELAKRAHIVLPEADNADNIPQMNRYEAAFDALRRAGNFYYRQLFSPSGTYALAYLRGRGFSDTTIKTFGLGFSPESFSATGAELKSQGISEEALLDAGLSVKNEEKGTVYDRFRGRLMFPIQNSTGRVIGFGARRMSDADTTSAKYINSPQSLVYDKSTVLYGIFQAKDALRRRGFAVLVEGYADALSVYQAGVHNVVASSGTALTREQLKLLGTYCKRLKIVYDADAAGINAALRGLDLAIEEGFDVEIVRLPQGDDPDSLIQRNGTEAFERCLEQALSLVHFKYDVFRAQGLMDTPSGQAEAVRGIVETIAKVPDTLKRDFMLRDVATRFGLPEQELYRELGVWLRKQQLQRIQEVERSERKERRETRDSQTAAPNVPPRETDKRRSGEANAPTITPEQVFSNHQQRSVEKPSLYGDLLPEERELLRVALVQAGAVGFMRERLHLSEETFVSDTGKRLFAMITEAAKKHREPFRGLLQHEELSEQDSDLLSALAVREETPSQRWRDFHVELSEDALRSVQDSAKQLLATLYKRELDALHNRLRDLNNADDELELLKAIKERDEQLRALHNDATLSFNRIG